MNKKSQKFFSNTGFNLLAQFVSLVVGIATSALLARGLGVELRGELAIILLFPTTLMAVFASGFTATVTYSVASKAWEENEIIPSISGIAIYLSAIMLFASAVVLMFHDRLFHGVPIYLLIFAIALIPVSVITNSLKSLLTGKQAFREKLLLTMLVDPLRLLVFAVLILAWPKNVGVGLLATVLAAAVAAVTFYRKCLTLCNQKQWFGRPRFDVSTMRNSLAYGGYAQIANLAGFLNYKADQFIVFWLLGPIPLGIYIIGVGLAEKLWLFVGNVSSVLFSLTAENKDQKSSGKIAARVGSIIFWFNIAIGVGLGIVSIPFINLVYTTEFSQSGVVVLYLLPGIVGLGHAKVLSNYIAGIGRPGINAAGAIIAIVINVIANLILIPRLEIIGAAVATSISYSLYSLYTFVCFIHLTKLKWHEPLVPSVNDLSLIYRYSMDTLRSLRSSKFHRKAKES